MADFATFDTRGYRTVDVRTGYGQWVETPEGTVENAMDVELLESLERGLERRQAGRRPRLRHRPTGAWLASLRIETIDGVDLTPQMLERARA